MFLSWSLSAQTDVTIQQLANAIKAPYTELDSTKVTTGYLMDSALDLVHVGLFDGTALCDSNYVDAPTFCDLLRTMNYAKINFLPLVYDAGTIYTSMTTSSNVKLRFALFKYHHLRGDAITAGLIEYDNVDDKFHDRYIGGEWQNPYDTDFVFMFSAGRQILESTSVTFDLSDLSLLSNCSSEISGMYIDFGNGYVSVPSSPLVPVTYNSESPVELKFKVILQSGRILESHTFISFVQPHAAQMSNSQADSTFTVTYGNISAQCSLKYHKSNDNNRTVKKPFIYVEGFDHPVMCELGRLKDHSLHDVYTNILLDTCSDNYSFDNSAYLAIINAGYDFFYVDWNNPEASILDNAQLLKQVICEVNRRVAMSNGERTVIAAHSMGGLITRCALKQMEDDKDNHNVDHFISQDVPYLGAVAPIGLQYSLRDLYQFLIVFGLVPNIRTVATKISDVLDCTSARQMMYNYVNFFDIVDNSEYNQFQYDLGELGFPQGDPGHLIENLTIVSGNDLGQSELSQSILSFKLFLTNIWYDHFIRYRSFKIEAGVNRDRGNGSRVSFTEVFYTKIDGLWPRVYPIFVREHCTSNSIQHVDAVPGSYLGDFGIAPNILYNNPFVDFDICNRIVFVPAASAMAYPAYDASEYDNLQHIEAGSPFDSYLLETSAQYHASGISRYFGWIHAHCSMRAEIPSIVLTGDTLRVHNAPADVTANNTTWGSSNSSLVSVSGDIVSVHGQGLVTLSMTAAPSDTNFVKYYRKHRTVLAGFPAMNLSAEHISGNQYTVSAECVSSNSELRAKVQELTSAGELKYIWGYKNSDDSYTWSDTTTVSSHTVTALSGTTTHVCMKLYNGPGREGPVNLYDIVRSTTARYYRDPQEILVYTNGYSLNYQYVSGLASYDYLAVWCNPDYSGTAIVPDSVEVGGVIYPVASTLYQTVNGDPVTIYCFDIINNPTLQNIISVARNAGSNPPIAFGTLVGIRSGGTTISSFFLPVVSRTNTEPIQP